MLITMKQKRFNPKTAEEWAEYWRENAKLEAKIKESNTSYIDLSDIEFKNSISNLSQDELKKMLESMRSTMRFYKKILEEPYYVEHPEKKKTFRYEESLRCATSINSKGKLVHSLINK